MVVRKWAVIDGSKPLPHPNLRLIAVLSIVLTTLSTPVGSHSGGGPAPAWTAASPGPTPVDNFTASLNRLVELVGFAGSGILALVWARVAMSWFSNDVTKKIQAKDRARDALIGTLLFLAAVTGLLYALAQWVLTGV